MAGQRELVLTLMKAWGYAPGSIGEIRPVLDVFRVETATGPMNLKWARHSDEKLLFILSALRHVAANEFHSLRLPLPTVAGEPFLVHDGQHYLLSEWIDGHQVDLTQHSQLSAACQTLARFHQASSGHRPLPGVNMRARRGQLVQSFARHCHELERFPLQTTGHSRLTSFDQAIRTETDYYLALAKFALALLGGSSYVDLAAQAANDGSLCHGDVAARNFILTPSGEVCLIDFDGLRQDLPLADLWKLFRRAMKAYHWNVDLGLGILEAYESVTSLSPRELEVLLALTCFPQKFWRLANRYYGGKYQVGEDRFYRKLRKYTTERLAHAAFLQRLAALCRDRGVTTVWPDCPFTGNVHLSGDG